MTTKPKTSKFRLKRTQRAAQPVQNNVVDAKPVRPSAQAAQPQASRPQPQAAAQPFAPTASSDGFGDQPFPGSAAASRAQPQAARPQGGVAQQMAQSQAAAQPAPSATPDQDIDDIRREGLTGRQLRMARRVAQTNGIAATSDFDAIRQLRQMGIDPFQKTSLADAITSGGAAQKSAPTGLPNVVEGRSLTAPAPTAPMNRAEVELEVSQIQMDIVRRRRRRLALLATRLGFFIALPTFLAAIYFYTIATPMYATHSAFVIQKSQAPSAGSGGLGGLLQGSPLGNSQDSITVQNFLENRNAMLRLDAEIGFKSHFSSTEIDAIQRLPEDVTTERAYKMYKKQVTIGYDPTEGLIQMEVVAADPLVSQQFSEALIRYAEEKVDEMTADLREDQEKGAREILNEAETKMQVAQERVIELQETLGMISPDAETQSLMSQISSFETQVQEKGLQLQQLLDNPRPNQARVDGVRGDIRRLEELIAELRNDLTQEQRPEGSLARITAELRMAEVELQTRQAIMQQSMQSLDTARNEATRQISYLSLSSTPIAPDEATHPKKFENTLVAFFVFAGIYLMLSLTAAVLREQVTA